MSSNYSKHQPKQYDVSLFGPGICGVPIAFAIVVGIIYFHQGAEKQRLVNERSSQIASETLSRASEARQIIEALSLANAQHATNSETIRELINNRDALDHVIHADDTPACAKVTAQVTHDQDAIIVEALGYNGLNLDPFNLTAAKAISAISEAMQKNPACDLTKPAS